MADDAGTGPTRRFTDRVGYYVRSRPGYPPAVLDHARRHCGWTPRSVVADVGAGTGIFTRLLLDQGNRVFAVEPNPAMLRACKDALGRQPGLTYIEAPAEATTLPDASVDLVMAAQAFHWFDLEEARREFHRILCPGGQVILIWNRRRAAGTPLLAAYEALLLEYSVDYGVVDHRKTADSGELSRLFEDEGRGYVRFHNRQVLGWEGLEDRLLSSSYAPMAGDPRHRPMMRELRRIFEAHQQDGTVAIDYDTEVYHGRPRGNRGGSRDVTALD